jgi:Ser/Thr protein kinase RdoA (MazF antagonist)
MNISWGNIEQSIDTLTKGDGGFSPALRGIVTLSDGRRVFVKVGVNDPTKQWAKKEVEVYRFLQRQNYPFIPQLLAYNNDETSFALEALMPEDGWNWSDEWTQERFVKTLEAMDVLAAIEPVGGDKDFFGIETLKETDDGWQPLKDSKEFQQTLRSRLRSAGCSDIANVLDFAAEAERSANFPFQKETLVHYDVRADNAPWHALRQAVRLVDWNWIQLGDRRIDLAALLVHVHQAGFDVTRASGNRLHADALHWLAGFWLKAAVTPIWPGGPAHLRDVQLRSAITALKLAAISY